MEAGKSYDSQAWQTTSWARVVLAHFAVVRHLKTIWEASMQMNYDYGGKTKYHPRSLIWFPKSTHHNWAGLQIFQHSSHSFWGKEALSRRLFGCKAGVWQSVVRGTHLQDSEYLPKQRVKLLLSYLFDRSYVVYCGDAKSGTYLLLAGVPQGSILGTLLYLLYTADILTTEQTITATYADDTAIHSTYWLQKGYNCYTELTQQGIQLGNKVEN